MIKNHDKAIATKASSTRMAKGCKRWKADIHKYGGQYFLSEILCYRRT